MPLGIGHALHGKYRLVRLLGDGGMGSVYEATHIRLGTRVAIKVLHPQLTSRPSIVERFLQEARVSAQIRSPHVAQVMDVDQAPEGHAYMVMELLDGETLLQLLERERKLSAGVASAFTFQILEGLEAAHALGVVHRDLKPENVFVTHGTQKTVVKLIDFGIAKVRREGAGLTLAGVTMGTAEYMAPEQAFSADRADARSDLFAVGVMLYEMLSGYRPVEGDDPRDIAGKVERGEVKPLVHALPGVAPPLAGFVHRAMAARAEMRFQSAPEMRLALDKLVGHEAGETLPLALVSPRPPDIVEQPRTSGPATVRGTPAPEPFLPPSESFESEPPPSPPVRSSALPLIAVALLLGIGAVVALALTQQSHASVPEAPSAKAQPSAPPTLAATTTHAPDEEPTASLKPLSKATPVATQRTQPKGVPSATPSVATSTSPFPFPNVPLPPFPTSTLLPPSSALPGEGPLP